MFGNDYNQNERLRANLKESETATLPRKCLKPILTKDTKLLIKNHL